MRSNCMERRLLAWRRRFGLDGLGPLFVTGERREAIRFRYEPALEGTEFPVAVDCERG